MFCFINFAFVYGGGRGIRTPVRFSGANCFQGTSSTRKLENFRGRYQTIKDAETTVFTRVFGVFYIRTSKILVAKSLSISKRISKKFLEIFLEMHTRLCGWFWGGCRGNAYFRILKISNYAYFRILQNSIYAYFRKFNIKNNPPSPVKNCDTVIKDNSSVNIAPIYCLHYNSERIVFQEVLNYYFNVAEQSAIIPPLYPFSKGV